MKDKDSKKEVEVKTITKHTTAGTVTVKPVPKNTSIVRRDKDSSTATTTITVKVVPKINKIVWEGKKAVTETSNSGTAKIRRPLATKN